MNKSQSSSAPQYIHYPKDYSILTFFLERERWRLWLVNGWTTLTHLNYEGSILHLMRKDSAFPRQRRKNGGSKQQKFRFHFHHPFVLNSKFIFGSVDYATRKDSYNLDSFLTDPCSGNSLKNSHPQLSNKWALLVRLSRPVIWYSP